MFLPQPESRHCSTKFSQPTRLLKSNGDHSEDIRLPGFHFWLRTLLYKFQNYYHTTPNTPNDILESFCFTFSCSISQISDYSVQVWDVRRPYVSFVSFNEHTDIPTSFLWMSNPHTLLSAGKDNLVGSNVIEFTILASLAKLTDI